MAKDDADHAAEIREAAFQIVADFLAEYRSELQAFAMDDKQRAKLNSLLGDAIERTVKKIEQ
jgi:hypothetical protein